VLKEEVVEQIDLSIAPSNYNFMGVLFLNELLDNQELFKVLTKDNKVHKKVYLRGNRLTRRSYYHSNFKYKLYNPYAKKSYFENRESVVKIEVNDDEVVERIKEKCIYRRFDSISFNKCSSVEEVQKALVRTIEQQKKIEEDDNMSKGYKKNMDNNVLDYLIKNKVPVKFYYITGEEEVLSLKMYDTYNYLAKNDEKGTTNFIQKGNVVKIEIMGDLEKIF
jgi:hypothetical protein